MNDTAWAELDFEYKDYEGNVIGVFKDGRERQTGKKKYRREIK